MSLYLEYRMFCVRRTLGCVKYRRVLRNIRIYTQHCRPIYIWGRRWCSWFMNCATSRNVSGSVPHGVIGSFHWLSISGRTMDLVSTQPLTEMSTRNISWEWGWGVTLPSWCAHFFKIWEPQIPETLRACPCLYRVCFTFLCMYCTYNRHSHAQRSLHSSEVCRRVSEKIYASFFGWPPGI